MSFNKDDVISGIVATMLANESARTAHICCLYDGNSIVQSVTSSQVRENRPHQFLLYSITKTMAAVVALHLVRQNQLALDGELGAWLPEFSPAGEFSLRQLLQHTAGLPDYGGLQIYHEAVRRGDPPWTGEEFLDRTNARQLRFTPGTSFSYSNIGYMLLRRVLTRATGASFENVLHRTVFVPSAMDDATIPTAKVDLSAFTFGPSPYLGSPNQPADVAQCYDPGWIATGVVGASPVSAARFVHALFAGGLLPTELLNEMQKGYSVGTAGGIWHRPAYGLGLMMDTDADGTTMLGHRGGGPGCSPAVFHFPQKKDLLTVCVITDGEDADQPVAMIRTIAKQFS